MAVTTRCLVLWAIASTAFGIRTDADDLAKALNTEKVGLGPDSAECAECKEPCEAMPNPQEDTIAAWQERAARQACLTKCVTGGAGMPEGPCREPPAEVTVDDIFSEDGVRIIIDSPDKKIFPPRANQRAWLRQLRGEGDGIDLSGGGYNLALKQINFEDQVLVLMFKESNSVATQVFVDGQENAEALRARWLAEPDLFDGEARPTNRATIWRPADPCDHENPAECCCQYQDRKFVTGFWYERKYPGADCTGQSIDNCGEGLNPMPGMIWYNASGNVIDPW